MFKAQMLRCLVNQRLTAAAEEICGLFARTIAEYDEELSASKEENERQRRLLDAVYNPGVRTQRAGVQQLFEVNEEVPPEQQVWSSSLDQEDPEPPHIKEDQVDPEPPHIKEEQEELWTSQEREQLQVLEEAGIKFSFTTVKSEDDEEEAQSSQLHQRQTEQMETEAYGAGCGGPESDRKSDPERHPGPDTFETEDSRDWEETQEPQPDLNPLQNNKVPVSDVYRSTGNTSISSSECAGSFDHRGHLEKHSESKIRVKPFQCSVCDKRFRFHSVLKSHMIVHSGENPFSCSVCGKTYAQKGSLNYHMTVHTGEKPFSCSVCGKKFLQKGSLNYHMTVHTGVKRFSCSVCSNTFLHRGHLNTHMTVHTGEKPFSCSVCGKTFTHKQSMKRHLIVHTRETN